MMRRLLALALAALLVRWLVLRRRSGETVVVGWEDGAALTLEPGAPERDRLVRAAESVIGR